MERLWLDFRRNPGAYLSSRDITNQDLVEELLQLLMTSSEKTDNTKLAALGILQERAPKLLNNSTRLETVVTSLKTIFQQFRTSGTPLICSQILCSMTSILIEMESIVEGEYLLMELIRLLFDVAEKVKTEGSLLLRATACDCLRELELAYPGILSSKVGHFYSMSQAETSHIFQHYLLLLAIVLEHGLKKHMLMLELGHAPDSTLSDLLFHADALKAYALPEDFKNIANKLLLKSPSRVLGQDSTERADVRRAVSFILDNYHLLTPTCFILTLNNVVATIELASLTPKILKGILLHYQSCQNFLPFYLVLLLKWRFSGDLCSEQDADSITMWFTLMASHPSLPAHQRELTLTYYLEWPRDKPPPPQENTIDSEGELTAAMDGGERERQSSVVTNSRHKLLPSVFDTYSTYFYKVKALGFQLESNMAGIEDDLSSPLPDVLSTVLKQAQYGIEGAPVVTLFRLLFSYYSSCLGYTSGGGSEICKLVSETVKDHVKYIPHVIDFITAIQRHFPESPVPLRLLADYLHHISTAPLLPHLPLYLLFLKQASLHPSINPLVVMQFLSRVVRDAPRCDVGSSWDVGSSILNIINIIMRTSHHTGSVFKGLTDLLELVITNYSDIDIQDRARFYHQLILSVSGEKLSALLALASDASSGSTLSDIVEARIADNTYPSAPPVHSITEKIFTLRRLTLSEKVFYESDNSNSEDSKTVVKDYMTTLDEDRAKLSSFCLQYQIQFLHCPYCVSDRIYAAVLKLSTDAPYHPCPDVYIPYMTCRDLASTIPSLEKCIEFTFFPKQPVPAVFRAQIVFTTEEGVTCVCDLDDVEVQFEDLFQPVPSPAISQPASSRELFAQLWTKLESSQNSVPSDGGRFSVLSTMHLDISRKEWEFRAKRLKLLQVTTSNRGSYQEGAGGDESCYLVFLPPCYHLLMRVRSDSEVGGAGGVAVGVATDCWQCLGLVSNYLHHIATGQDSTQRID